MKFLENSHNRSKLSNSFFINIMSTNYFFVYFWIFKCLKIEKTVYSSLFPKNIFQFLNQVQNQP